MADDDQTTKKPEPPPTLPSGITEPEFAHWKHHPVTLAYLQFLSDLREIELQQVIMSWEAGRVSMAGSDEARGLRNALLLASTPNFDGIVEFYERRRQIIEQQQEEIESDEHPDDGEESAAE